MSVKSHHYCAGFQLKNFFSETGGLLMNIPLLRRHSAAFYKVNTTSILLHQSFYFNRSVGAYASGWCKSTKGHSPWGTPQSMIIINPPLWKKTTSLLRWTFQGGYWMVNRDKSGNYLVAMWSATPSHVRQPSKSCLQDDLRRCPCNWTKADSTADHCALLRPFSAWFFLTLSRASRRSRLNNSWIGRLRWWWGCVIQQWFLML